MKHYGIIGYPLGHSFSPAFFAEKFAREGIDATYKAYPLEDIGLLPALLKSEQLAGLNVTIPYKQAVIPFLNELDTDAAQVGAVNCIATGNGILRGYNTDITGFSKSLGPLLRPWHDRALILGTGGGARAVAHVLRKLGILYKQVSRNATEKNLAYGDVNAGIVARHKLIINTTPLGMHPDIASFPRIAYDAMGAEHLAYDLVYNPAETVFLAKARAHGAVTKNGMDMLYLQALAAWETWNK